MGLTALEGNDFLDRVIAFIEVLEDNDNVQGIRFHMNPLFSDDAYEIFFLIWSIQGGIKMTSAANFSWRFMVGIMSFATN